MYILKETVMLKTGKQDCTSKKIKHKQVCVCLCNGVIWQQTQGLNKRCACTL